METPAPPAAYREGTVLFGLQPGVPAERAAAAAAAVGGHGLELRGAGVYVLRVRAGTESQAIETLHAMRDVRYAELDYQHHLDGLPNDPALGYQWGYLNAGQTVGGTAGTPGADERASYAWGVATGSAGVVVAVLDSGIEYTHPDLAPNVWSNPGGVNGCAAGTHGYNVLTGLCDPMDDDTTYNGHGTHVSGIIGAAGNNGIGGTGVNWTVGLMGVKWVSSGGTGYTSDLVSAMDWVIRAKQAGVNVRVVNDSATWPGTGYSQALADEIDALTAADILFVSASGNTAQNNDTTPRYPCSYDRPGQLCVAASDQNDQLWSSANWGATTVNLAAPGVNIYSTLRGGSYGLISGGSMACAQVSGAAALFLSVGYQPVSQIRGTVLQAVDQLPALSGLVATGGRLDLCKGLPGCSTVPPPTGISLVQSASVKGSNTSSLAQSFAAPAAAGNLILAFVRMSGTTQTVTVTDSVGDRYVEAVGQKQTSDGHQTHLFYAANVSGGATRVTASFSGNNKRPWLAVFEYQGLSTTAPLDQTAAAQGSGSLATTGLTGLTAPGAELVFAGLGLPVSGGVNASAGTGFTLLQSSAGSGSPGATEAETVTTSGRYAATFTLSSSTSWSAVAATFVASGGAVPPPPLAVTTTSLPGGTVGASYSASLTASGGTPPYSWSVSAGSLPDGLVLAPATGAITGTPTTAATSDFTVTATDSAAAAQTATAALSITVVAPAPPPPLVVTTTSLPGGTTGTGYSATLAASGGTPPYSWGVTTGALPDGLGLAPATGAITGTPTIAATSFFTVTATDSAAAPQTASAALSIAVVAPPPPPTFVQSAAVQGSSVAAVALPLTAPTTSGDLLIAFVRMSSTSQTVAVSDSAGNVYAHAVSQSQSSDGHQTHIFYAPVTAAGGTTVTATFSGTNGHPWLAVYEYSGPTALDQVAHSSGSSTAPSCTTPPTAATELVIAGAGLPSSSGVTVAAGSGFTLGLQDSVQYGSRAATAVEPTAPAGAVTASFTLSGSANWSCVAATFR